MRKAGQRVRITAQLIDGTTGNHVWAERYDRDLNDIFALQDEISQAIVAALKLKLLPRREEGASSSAARATPRPTKFCLMARQHYLIGMNDTRRLDAVIRLCQRAVEIDPDYARAWALMAGGAARRHVFRQQGTTGWLRRSARWRSMRTSRRRMRRARERCARRGDYDGGLKEIEIGLAARPGVVGRQSRSGTPPLPAAPASTEAIRFFEKAATLRETDWSSCSMLISCYTAVGDIENARRAARRTLAVRREARPRRSPQRRRDGQARRCPRQAGGRTSARRIGPSAPCCSTPTT